MRVADFEARDDVGHLHPRAQLVGLRLGGEDAHLAGLEIVEHRSRHVGQRPRGDFFEYPGAIWRAQRIELGGQRSGNLDGGMVGNQGNFFVRLNAQTNHDGVARSFDERGFHGHFL